MKSSSNIALSLFIYVMLNAQEKNSDIMSLSYQQFSRPNNFHILTHLRCFNHIHLQTENLSASHQKRFIQEIYQLRMTLLTLQAIRPIECLIQQNIVIVAQLKQKIEGLTFLQQILSKALYNIFHETRGQPYTASWIVAKSASEHTHPWCKNKVATIISPEFVKVLKFTKI